MTYHAANLFTDYGDRSGMASCAQLELIRVIWMEHTEHRDADARGKWLLRTFRVSSLHYLRKDAAPRVMKARAA